MKIIILKLFYKKKSLANILSFSTVARKFSIIVDIDLEPDINVHLYDGNNIIFKK